MTENKRLKKIEIKCPVNSYQDQIIKRYKSTLQI